MREFGRVSVIVAVEVTASAIGQIKTLDLCCFVLHRQGDGGPDADTPNAEKLGALACLHW